MTDKSFYVGINTPTQLRKALLLSSRDLIGTLKQYESVKALRTQKMEAILELRNEMQDLEKLNRKIKSIFPKGKESKQKATTKKKKRGTVSIKKEADKLAMLESELSKIEGQLNKL